MYTFFFDFVLCWKTCIPIYGPFVVEIFQFNSNFEIVWRLSVIVTETTDAVVVKNRSDTRTGLKFKSASVMNIKKKQ